MSEVGLMPKWEVCMIQSHSYEVPGKGFSSEKSMHAWQADLFTASGESTVLAQTSGWKGQEPRRHTFPDEQLRGLIAQLGLDGWEPMPVVIVNGDQKPPSHVEWYFKPQLPDM